MRSPSKIVVRDGFRHVERPALTATTALGDGPMVAERRNGTLVTYEARGPQAGAPNYPTKRKTVLSWTW